MTARRFALCLYELARQKGNLPPYIEKKIGVFEELYSASEKIAKYIDLNEVNFFDAEIYVSDGA